MPPSSVRIRIVPERDPAAGGTSAGTSALRPDDHAPLLLRFRIQAESDALETLRQVRRSMLREESTLGRAEGEPSFEDAVFSPEGIVWSVTREQREYCLEKIAALEARVARALAGDRHFEAAAP